MPPHARLIKHAVNITAFLCGLMTPTLSHPYEISPDLYVFPVSQLAPHGTNYQVIEQELGERGLKEGMLVLSLPSIEPLYSAGIRSGDIITELNHTGITDVKQFFTMLIEHDPNAGELEISVLKIDPEYPVANLRNRIATRLTLTAPHKEKSRSDAIDPHTQGILGALKKKDDLFKDASTETTIVLNLAPIVTNKIDAVIDDYEKGILACVEQSGPDTRACAEKPPINSRYLGREKARQNIIEYIKLIFDGRKDAYALALQKANEDVPAYESLVRNIYKYSTDRAAGNMTNEKQFLEKIRPILLESANLKDRAFNEFADKVYARAEKFAAGAYMDKYKLAQSRTAKPKLDDPAKPPDTQRTEERARESDADARVKAEAQARLKKEFEQKCKQTDGVKSARKRATIATRQNATYKSLPYKFTLGRSSSVFTRDEVIERCVGKMVDFNELTSFDVDMYEYMQRSLGFDDIDKSVLCDKDKKIFAIFEANKKNNKKFNASLLKAGLAVADVEKCLKNPKKYLN